MKLSLFPFSNRPDVRPRALHWGPLAAGWDAALPGHKEPTRPPCCQMINSRKHCLRECCFPGTASRLRPRVRAGACAEQLRSVWAGSTPELRAWQCERDCFLSSCRRAGKAVGTEPASVSSSSDKGKCPSVNTLSKIDVYGRNNIITPVYLTRLLAVDFFYLTNRRSHNGQASVASFH